MPWADKIQAQIQAKIRAKPCSSNARCGALQLAAAAFGPGSLTPQNPLKTLRKLFKRMGPAL